MMNEIDLGLSVNWADCNIGANDITDAGLYFGWGCCAPFHDEAKEQATWESYFSKISGENDAYSYDDCGTDKDPLASIINEPKGYGLLNGRFDAACNISGDVWRMPSFYHWKELKNFCTWEEQDINGIGGYRLTSKINENSIFLPYGGVYDNRIVKDKDERGYYWSSSPHRYNAAMAEYMKIGACIEPPAWSWTFRIFGMNIRPIKLKPQSNGSH